MYPTFAQFISVTYIIYLVQSQFTGRMNISLHYAATALVDLNWNLELAAKRIHVDWITNQGYLVCVDPLVRLLGFVNVEGTSCYLGSLCLFLLSFSSVIHYRFACFCHVCYPNFIRSTFVSA